MASQKIFTTKCIDKMVSAVRGGQLQAYHGNQFAIEPDATEFTGMVIGECPELIIPQQGDRSDNIENVKTIFSAYKKLSRAQATDVRFWAYLTQTRVSIFDPLYFTADITELLFCFVNISVISVIILELA
jgi:hypothetical protein